MDAKIETGSEIQVGSKVWLRWLYTKEFSLRGIVEAIDGDTYKVRLENGRFCWANADQLMLRVDL